MDVWVYIITMILVVIVIIVTLMYNNKQLSLVKKSLEKNASIDEGKEIGAITTLITNHLETMKSFELTTKELYVNLPKTVLHTIQGSINPRKGKVGELITLLQLSSEYDRLIPMGKPIDFIGISNNSIDFIEVKVDGSQLTKEERHIRDLIKSKSINFVTVRKSIEIENLSECIEQLDQVKGDAC
jgi:predicted Holliday junction resolvase-like endonuclease